MRHHRQAFFARVVRSARLCLGLRSSLNLSLQPSGFFVQTQASVLALSWGRHAASMDIGTEPPIEADGRRHTPEDHRHISLRWLTGTILTGLTGALLIGAAVYSALDGESNFAEAPTLAVARAEKTDAAVNPRKGDRLVKSVDIVAAK